MKKYFFIWKSEIMTNLQYVFDFVGSLISYMLLIYIFLILWNYVYEDPTKLINGYQMNQMIWYVIITELLWMSLSGRGLCQRICNDVRTGNVAYNINKPYNYVGYSLASHLGLVTIRFMMIGVIGLVLGYLFLGGFPTLTLLQGLGVLLSCVLATVINALLIISIGLISFYIEDANPLYWLYSKVILVIGTLFPVEFFPQVLQPIIKMSPIYVVSYGPAKLFVDFKMDYFIKILLTQGIYLLISIIICAFIYSKGVKKLNVNGG